MKRRQLLSYTKKGKLKCDKSSTSNVADADIKKLTAFYRETFPEESFPPKFHMLESHVVSFIRKLRFPFGFYGQQGGESIHHEFVGLENNFSGVHPLTKRYKGMLQRHYTNIYPENRRKIPKKTRNLKKKQHVE